MEIFSPAEAVVAALVNGDEAGVLRLLTDIVGLERRFGESLDALLTDLAFVLRLAPTPLSADAELTLPSGARASRETLVLLETFLEQRREQLLRDRAQFFPLLFDWFYWLSPDYERWVDGERRQRVAPPGTPSPHVWLRRLPPEPIRDRVQTCFGIPGTLRERSRDERLLLVTCDLPLYERQEGWTLGGGILTAPARLAAYRGNDVSLYGLATSEPVAQLPSAPAPIQQLRFADGNRVLVTATPQSVHAWQSADGAPLGVAGGGPLSQLLPMDHGPMILHHQSGSRLFDWKTATPIGIKGPVPEQCHYTQGDKKETYRLSRDATREVRLVDGSNGRVLLGIILAARMKIESPSTDLSPDGKRMIVWNRGLALLWSTETLAPIAALPPFGDGINTSISAVEFSSDSELFFIANGNTLSWFVANDGTLLGSVRFADSERNEDYVHLARAGARSVLLHVRHAWHFVDPASGTLGPRIPVEYHAPPVVAPDGSFAVMKTGNAMVVHSLESGALRFQAQTYSGEVAIAPDGSMVELRDPRGVRRFDAATGEELSLDETQPIADPTSRIKAGRDRIVVSTGAYGAARLLLQPEPRLPHTPVRFLGDGRHLLTEHDSGLRLWDLTTGRRAIDWPGERVLLAVGVATDRPRRLLIRRSDALVLRDLVDGRQLWGRPRRSPVGARASFSSSTGTLLVEEGAGLLVLDAESGEERYFIADAKLQKQCDRHVVLTLGSQPNTIVEIATGRTIAQLSGAGDVLDVSRDGKWLLRLGDSRSCEIWQLADTALVTALQHDGGGACFLEDPLRVQTFESISPQSGNTDTDTWREYAVPSGALIATRSEDVYAYGYLDRSRSSGPLAPGVAIEGSTWLVVDGSRLQLDAKQEVGVGADGVIYVASEAGSLFDLYCVERSTSATFAA